MIVWCAPVHYFSIASLRVLLLGSINKVEGPICSFIMFLDPLLLLNYKSKVPAYDSVASDQLLRESRICKINCLKSYQFKVEDSVAEWSKARHVARKGSWVRISNKAEKFFRKMVIERLAAEAVEEYKKQGKMKKIFLIFRAHRWRCMYFFFYRVSLCIDSPL